MFVGLQDNEDEIYPAKRLTSNFLSSNSSPRRFPWQGFQKETTKV